MEILYWLAVPLGLTALAMLWATWAGRSRREPDEQEQAERFGAALARPVPAPARTVVAQTPERPSGVAVRPSQRALRDGAPNPRPPGRVAG
ncbi:MAG: hypothetical protein M3419_03795 [Actinomycetota bacterium]|nr:hypothetical protein [Actinomycetota bacterium]